jgi:hypothetical protein
MIKAQPAKAAVERPARVADASKSDEPSQTAASKQTRPKGLHRLADLIEPWLRSES